MFAKIVVLFALIAVAFAAPKPEPSPQILAYSSPYAYPSYSYISPYTAGAIAPLASNYYYSNGLTPFYVR